MVAPTSTKSVLFTLGLLFVSRLAFAGTQSDQAAAGPWVAILLIVAGCIGVSVIFGRRTPPSSDEHPFIHQSSTPWATTDYGQNDGGSGGGECGGSDHGGSDYGGSDCGGSDSSSSDPT